MDFLETAIYKATIYDQRGFSVDNVLTNISPFIDMVS